MRGRSSEQRDLDLHRPRLGRRALADPWVTLVLVPAWTSFSRVWERIVATVLSVYVLAAFVLAGLLLGGGFLWYFDEL